MESKIITLIEVLDQSCKFPWNFALYLPFNEKWTTETKCAVLNTAECLTDENDHPFAKQNGLEYALGIQQIQDIFENAKNQKPNIDKQTLLNAFLYYYDNDKFISLH